MSTDVTGDRERVPFELQDAEGLLWTLARNTSDCVKLIDLDGSILRWNGACEDLYGWTAHEAVGTKMPQVPAEQRLRAIADIRSIAAAGRAVEREVENVRSDGTGLRVRVLVIPVSDRDGHPAGVLSIVSELARDARLEQQRSELIALIGHRLTEPLASVASNARLLMRPEIGADNPRRAAIADSLAGVAESSAGFLETLMITSRLESGRLKLAPEPVDLALLVTDIAARMQGGRVDVDFDPSLPAIAGDRALLEHAIAVLLQLALRVTPQHERVSASIHAGRGTVVLDICDRGPSLAHDELRLLTTSPYTGHDVRGEDGGAMALGFAAAITHAHRARFQVRAVTPCGARYTIEFDEPTSRKDPRKA